MLLIIFTLTCLLVVYFMLEAAYFLANNTARPIHLFYAAAGATVLCTVAGAFTALLGLFSVAFVCAGMVIVGLAAKCILLRRHKVPAVSFQWLPAFFTGLRWPRPATVAMAGIAATAALVYILFPTHYFLGSSQPGLYEIHAVHISETGSFWYERDTLYAENESLQEMASATHVGFYESGGEDANGQSVPEFLPVYPSLLAVAYSLFGFSGLLRVNALLGLLSLFGLYYFAKRHWGTHIALLACAFLAVCPAQMWGAQIIQAEQLTQLLFLLTAYTFSVAWQKNSGTWAIAAASLAGVNMFVQTNQYLSLTAFFLVALYTMLWDAPQRRIVRQAAVTVAGFAVASLLYGLLFQPGTYTNNWFIIAMPWQLLCSLLVVCAIVLCRHILLNPKRRLPSNPIQALVTNGILPGVVCLVLLGLAFYAYFIRPINTNTFIGRNIREFSWYISPPAIFLAIAGLYFIFRPATAKLSRQEVEPLLYFLLHGAASVLFLGANPYITETHPFVSRLWVPVNYPFILLLVAVCAISLWQKATQDSSQKFVERLISLFSVACVLIFMAWQCRVFAFTRILAGINGQYAVVAESIPEDAVAITRDKGLAAVLTYVYNRNVYVLYPDAVDEPIPAVEPDGEEENDEDDEPEPGPEPSVFEPEDLISYLERYTEIYYIGYIGDFWEYVDDELILESVVGGETIIPTSGKYPMEKSENLMDTTVYKLTYRDTNQIKHHFLRDLSLPETSVYEDDVVYSEQKGLVFFGPYIELAAGTYRVEVDIYGDSQVNAKLTTTIRQGRDILATARTTENGTLWLEFTLDSPTKGVEFVLHNLSNSTLACDDLRLYVVDSEE